MSSDSTSAVQDDVSSLESELIEKTERLPTKHQQMTLNLPAMMSLLKNLDENLETIEAASKSETELESGAEVARKLKKK